MVIYECDGCKKQEKLEANENGFVPIKPRNWFSREDSDGKQLACSRDCIQKIAKETGKTGVILPI